MRRERDSEDRRKVFIAIVVENVAKIGRLYEPMQRAVMKQWEAYSDAELKLLLRFANQSYQTMLEATANLKTMIAPKETSKETKDNAQAQRSLGGHVETRFRGSNPRSSRASAESRQCSTSLISSSKAT